MNNTSFYPPVNISLQESSLLQKYLDDLGPTDGNSSGGEIVLPRGHFYGNLVVSQPFTHVRGQGEGTVFHGSILCTAGYCTFSDLWVKATGQSYGMRFSNTNPAGSVGLSGVPRCGLTRVRIGATFENAGDGPVDGLQLDGAILTHASRCLFAFCTGNGVFLDTTDTGVGGPHPWSTNVSRFSHCTSNLNKGWGYLFTGGALEGVEIVGGNCEDNGDPGNPGSTGAVKASGMNHLIIRNVDFEQDSSHNVTDLLDISTCNPFEIVRNNFGLGAGAGTQRAWIISTCMNGKLIGNRMNGFAVNTAIGVIDNNCVDCEDWPNGLADAGTYLENRSRWS